MFQLIYLYATQPRKDAEAFDSYRVRMKGDRREARGAARDRLRRPHQRDRHPEASAAAAVHLRRCSAELDLDRSLAIYADRFADLGDATFIFVGAFDLAGIEPLVRTYLGNLPSTGRQETFRDVGVVDRRAA